MLIKKNSLISDLQKEFNAVYPGLKIVFYKKGHGDHEGSQKASEYESGLKISEIQNSLNDGSIDLSPTKSVAQLEQEFEENFGLHVQVFRRSNTLWLQTVRTDDWTLEVQNSKGLHSIQNN